MMIEGCASTPVVQAPAPACRTLSECERACDGGDAVACLEAGTRYERGVSVPRTLARAVSYHAQGCSGGLSRACVAWARTLDQVDDTATGDSRVTRLYEEACTEGEGEACLRLALREDMSQGSDRLAAGFGMLQAGCAGDEVASCVTLASFAFSGILGDADLLVAAGNYGRACDEGDAVACVRLAALVQQRHPAAEATGRDANGLLARACEIGMLRACTEVHSRALDDAGVSARRRRQATLQLARLCDRGQADACAVYGTSLFRMEPRTPAHEVAAAAQYRRGCELDHGPGCAALAHLYAEGIGVTLDVVAAHAYFTRGCALGVTSACTQRGWMEAEGLIPGADPVAGLRQVAAACTQGDGVSCARVGRRALQELAFDEAVPLFERSCRLGEPDGCAGLVAAKLDRDGTTRSVTQSLDVAKYACQEGSGSGCVLAGQLYELGGEVTANLPLAQRYFYEACALGQVDGCEAMAQRAPDSLSAAFWEAGAQLRDRNCAQGSKEDCVVLGVYLQRGLAGTVSPQRAVSHYAEGCDAGLESGCLYLGQMLMTGDGVEADPGAASEWLSRGCALGSADACAWAALPYHLGRGVEQDFERAARAYASACERGSSFGCIGMGKLHESGAGVPRNQEASRQYFAEACRLGARSYCR